MCRGEKGKVPTSRIFSMEISETTSMVHKYAYLHRYRSAFYICNKTCLCYLCRFFFFSSSVAQNKKYFCKTADTEIMIFFHVPLLLRTLFEKLWQKHGIPNWLTEIILHDYHQCGQ